MVVRVVVRGEEVMYGQEDGESFRMQRSLSRLGALAPDTCSRGRPRGRPWRRCHTCVREGKESFGIIGD